jgi:hypothetical protein
MRSTAASRGPLCLALKERKERETSMSNQETYWTQRSVRRGACPAHGSVNAVKSTPKPHFPYMVYVVRRLIGPVRPYRCPACGAKTTAL